jgi:hypothetical protein
MDERYALMRYMFILPTLQIVLKEEREREIRIKNKNEES